VNDKGNGKVKRKKTKKGHRSWISKYHFHDALLLDDKKTTEGPNVLPIMTKPQPRVETYQPQPLPQSITLQNMMLGGQNIGEDFSMQNHQPIMANNNNNRNGVPSLPPNNATAAELEEWRILSQSYFGQTVNGENMNRNQDHNHGVRPPPRQASASNDVIDLLSSDDEVS
jgi:hypothetical protein